MKSSFPYRVLIKCIANFDRIQKISRYYRSRWLSVDFCSCFWRLMPPVPYSCCWILLFFSCIRVCIRSFTMWASPAINVQLHSKFLVLFVVWPVVIVVDNGEQQTKKKRTHTRRSHTYTCTRRTHNFKWEMVFVVVWKLELRVEHVRSMSFCGYEHTSMNIRRCHWTF